MFIIAVLLSLIPLVWAGLSKYLFKREVHWIEACGVFVGGVVAVIVGLAVSYGSMVTDTEVLNGKVTSKQYQNVSCTHSYDCNCRTDKDGHRSCDTCYYHPFDRNWEVDSTVGSLNIDRVDWQGLREPDRWTAVKIGEPFAAEHRYTNYVQGAKDTLFRFSELPEQVRKSVPQYSRVHDYYRFYHVKSDGAAVPDLEQWNAAVANELITLGSAKQVNINILFTRRGPDFAEQLETTWIGGKKNDVNIVIGVSQWPKADWVYAFTFAKSAGNAMTTIRLRDALTGQNLSVERTVPTVTRIISESYTRKSMKEFEYLAAEILPSTFAIVCIIIFVLLVLAGITYFVTTNQFSAGDRL